VSRVAVTSRSFSQNMVLRAELLDRYPDTTFNDTGASLRGDDLIAFLDGHEKAVTALEPIDAAVLDRLPDLKAVSKYGVGYDMLDLAAFAARGVRLGWTGGVNRRAVSELCLHMMIGLLRRVPHAVRRVLDGDFRQVQGRQLSDTCVGIIGFGHVGRDLAGLLRAFGTRVVVHDIRDVCAAAQAAGAEVAELDTLLAACDIVSLHVPLDDTTDGLLDARRLDLLREGAFVINAARGGLVDEEALKQRLLDGRLGGAGLDVFRPEPPHDMELLGLDTVIATPHIGGSAVEAVLAMGRAAIRGLDDNRVPDASWPPDY
jgi:phosphoglycerate dehydrogenase-like enzyme